MNITTFNQLLTPTGQEVLAAAASLEPVEKDFLRYYDQLCRTYPPDLSRAALETAILRVEARAKFPDADRMYFTRQALEQATSHDVAAYRAGRFMGYRLLADLGCSIGSDSLAMARVAPVLAIDMDPLRLAIARANSDGAGLGERVSLLQADLRRGLPFKAVPGTGLFFDPARRDERGRVYSVRAYTPPLSTVSAWLLRFPALGVKLSPGVNLVELSGYDAEVEFISLNGELKEAVLWFGPLKSAFRRATLLPGEYSLCVDQDTIELSPNLSEPRQYLYEPDPAVLRAGLVRHLASQLDACQLDPEIAYLTAGTYTPTPFARAWEVEVWFPFSLKRLRRELRARNVGETVVKKRGSPLEPEALIRDLRLAGDEFRWVFLTQMNGKPIVVLAEQEIVTGQANAE